jgi:predicted ATP-dependent endonuclease of OLD family
MILRPIAFRILNYKSIRDSGVCTLSGDGITVLAGQNEAGKTSILTALDEFNLDMGVKSANQDFIPDHSPDSIPQIHILFEADIDGISEVLAQDSIIINPSFVEAWRKQPKFWLFKQPTTGNLYLDSELAKSWPKEEIPKTAKAADGATTEGETSEAIPEVKYATWSQLGRKLFHLWPEFVYFDSFDDRLPREIEIDLVTKAIGGAVVLGEPDLPQPVLDFLMLSGIDLNKVRELAALSNEKKVRNYLNSKSAEITGEFHGYWQQTTVGDQKVILRAEHFRRDGKLYLGFYADDGKTMQFPDQRSKGFSWFLAFYLRLSASVFEKDDKLPQFILVDEPGSFLHQKAQQDILQVLEKRIAKNDVVIYSSHSPYMMPPDKMFRVRVVSKDKKGATFIADRLTDPRIQRDEKGDALSPVMAAIGLDVGSGSHVMHKENIVVEGITDYYYLLAWAKLLDKKTFESRGIIAAKGTKNIPNLVSLCLAWSRSFAILIDRDDAGDNVRKDLTDLMNISPKVIVSYKDALTIEDLFSAEDFRMLITKFDPRYKLAVNEAPSTLIKREKVDKVLLARKFAELIQTEDIKPDGLTQKTKDAARQLLESLETALAFDAVLKIT